MAIVSGGRAVASVASKTFMLSAALLTSCKAESASDSISATDLLQDLTLLAGVAGAVRGGAAGLTAAVQAAKQFRSRSAAFRAAKQLAGIPMSAQAKVSKVRLRDQPGNVQARVYTFVRSDGSTVIISEHSLGHAKGNRGPHFNVEIRPFGGGPKQALPGGADDHVHFGQ